MLRPLLLLFCGLNFLHAQGTEYIKAHYTKYDYEIAMRDGVLLFTSVYIPKAAEATQPILLFRTPYSVRPYGEDQYPATLGPSELFAKEGYIFAYQDVRGRFHSAGAFEHVRPHKLVKKNATDVDESTDTWDTIDWLTKHVPANMEESGWGGSSTPAF